MKATMKRLGSALMAVCLIAALSATAFAASFTDVPESHWSYQYVEEAHTNGLVNGTGSGQYTPDKSVTNAEWSQMLANLFAGDSIVHGPTGAWWFPAVSYTHQRNWLNGTELLEAGLIAESNPFNKTIAESAISRYDMAQIICNIATQNSEFTLTVDPTGVANEIADYRDIPSKYRTAVEYCYAAGFIVGVDSKGTFNGTNPMTRGAAATVLCRLFDAKNGDWVVPTRDGGMAPTPTVTAVKDMITVKSTERVGYDYEIIVKNSTIAGKLSNGKDITDANIKAMLDELKAVFPHGTSWGATTNSGDAYYNYNKPFGGGGCNAWVNTAFDVIFGADSKYTSSADMYSVKIGDVIVFKNNSGTSVHMVFVTSVVVEKTSKFVNGQVVYFDDTVITYCHGNTDTKVNWNDTMSVSAMLGGYPNSVLYTAY